MTQEKQLTRSEAITLLAAQLDAPISLKEFVERVLSIWQSHAKNPQAGVRQGIRDNHLGKTLIFLDEKTLVPMQIGLSGVCVRVPISRQEINSGLLFIYPSIQFLVTENFAFEDMQLVDATNRTIPTKIVTQQLTGKGFLGEYTREVHSLDLGWWYKKHKIKRGDSLLVAVLDWAAGKFRLEPETKRKYRRIRTQVEASNQKLADTIFALLEASRYECVWGQIAIPTVYARLKNELADPADHWLQVIENDLRMRWDGNEICYADSLTFVERLMPELHQERLSSSPSKLSTEQRNQLYRFKAHYKYRKGLWRRIEIQGGQTLTDLDEILREAFQHDPLDHMSGFWQRIRRGNSRRFREVELATIKPFGKGDGADKPIADLNLNPGDMLKYVYDFGDWVEYYIVLEEVDMPEVDVSYPRVISQNRPRYKYCPSCQKKGRKTIATIICIWCSNEEQEEVIMCEDCIDPDHEEHYLVEIVY
jgi:hypothetical protein